MQREHFEWDEQNVDHIARHAVDPDEAEAAMDNRPLLLRTAEGRYLAYGETDNGRYLLVVFIRKPGAMIRVTTARDMTDAEKKRYRGRRK